MLTRFGQTETQHLGERRDVIAGLVRRPDVNTPVGRERREFEVRRVDVEPAGEVHRAQAFRNRERHPHAGRLSAEKTPVELGVVRHENAAVEQARQLGRYLREGGRVGEVVGRQPMNVNRARVAARVHERRPVLGDGAVDVHEANGDLNDAIMLQVEAGRLYVNQGKAESRLREPRRLRPSHEVHPLFACRAYRLLLMCSLKAAGDNAGNPRIFPVVAWEWRLGYAGGFCQTCDEICRSEALSSEGHHRRTGRHCGWRRGRTPLAQLQTTRRLRQVGALGVASATLLTLAACGGKTDASSSPSASQTPKSTASAAPTSPAAPSEQAPTQSGAAGDAPIAGDNFSLNSGAPKSYGPGQTSGPGATDCYSGGTRVYDRSGVTCGQAISTMLKYNATAAGAKGDMATVDGYQCSWNPTTMVNQGAAPAKCTDSSGNVVFNWRYPGAPGLDRGK